MGGTKVDGWMGGWILRGQMSVGRMDEWILDGLMSVGRHVDEMEGRWLDGWKAGWMGRRWMRDGWGKWRGRGQEKASGGAWGLEGLCLSRDTVLLHWVLAWCGERKHLEFGALALLQIEKFCKAHPHLLSL